MRVKVPFGVFASVGRLLVEAEGIGKGDLKKAIEAGGGAFQNIGQGIALGVLELVDGRYVALGEDHGLKRPDRPKWDHDQEMVIFLYSADAGGSLQCRVVAE